MKWTLCLIVLLLANGSMANLESEEDSNAASEEDSNAEDEEDFDVESYLACKEREREECLQDRPPKEFPKTAEELLALCHMGTRTLRCVLRVRDSCWQEKEELQYLRQTLDYFDNVCQEENPVFKEIASHLECIEDSIPTSNVCSALLYRDKDNDYAMTGQVASFVEKSSVLNEDNKYCVDSFFRVACPSITVGIHCGNKVRDAMYEVFKNTDDYVRCGEEVQTELEPLLDIFEALVMEKIDSENEIDRK